MNDKNGVWAYQSTEDGVCRFNTQDEALAAARADLKVQSEYASQEPWNLNARQIKVFQVTHEIKVVKHFPDGPVDDNGLDEAGEYWGDCDEPHEKHEYLLEPTCIVLENKKKNPKEEA